MTVVAHLIPSARSRYRETLVRFGWALIDACMIVVAAFIAAWMRYDFTVSDVRLRSVATFALAAAFVYLVLSLATGPYRVSHVRGSFEEVVDLGRAGVLAMAVLGAAVLLLGYFNVPRSMPFTTPVIGVVFMCAVRFIVRSYRWGRTTAREDDVPVIVYGVGARGRQLIRTLLREPSNQSGRYVPVAAIDDDPHKRRVKVDGVHVRGNGIRLAEVAEATGANTVVVAIPHALGDDLKRIQSLAREAGLNLLVLPPVKDILSPTGSDLRQLQLEDLLGRPPVTLDEAAIADAISGKRVLVTGAGGSIGSELCRQIAKFGPAKLVLLDRDESALHATQLSMTGRALLDDGTLALADIRDERQLQMVFERERPELVFHTAALKHLTLLEQFPLEAWKTNVVGTLNVLEAARRAGVGTFVNISTDKAANPSCVLGYSKRCAERLTAAYASYDVGTYVSVRFGNVLGSRGSVITAFTAQIERGGPVTVTHPDVERYFMLIPEACQLVLQASAIGSDGEVMVLEMGEPMKIADMAQTLIELSGKNNVEITYTGLRPGEKLSEELFSPTERVGDSTHPLVHHTPVPYLPPSQAREAELRDGSDAFDWMLRESTGHIGDLVAKPSSKVPTRHRFPELSTSSNREAP